MRGTTDFGVSVSNADNIGFVREGPLYIAMQMQKSFCGIQCKLITHKRIITWIKNNVLEYKQGYCKLVIKYNILVYC